MKQANVQTKPQWVKILGKGMITIPKVWREDLALSEGDIVRAQKVGSAIVIEPIETPAPYRIYSRSELNQFLADDRLPEKELEKFEAKN